MPYHSHEISISKMLEGYRRSKFTKDTRLPITYEILVEICVQLQSICKSEYEVTLFKAAYTLAFFGLFIVGELVSSSAATINDIPLYLSDIHGLEQNSKFRVSLRQSKTNQSGAPVIVHIVATNTASCPVKAMKAYLRVRPPQVIPNYLFCHNDGSPLTRYQFGAVLSKVIRSLKLNDALYKTHSFRIGAATWLAKQGVKYDQIKQMGRWTSDAFKRYIRY